MARQSDTSASEVKSITSRTSQLSVLNDEECKRILEVLERDFKLRQEEFKRLDAIKRKIRHERGRLEYIEDDGEFNREHCIRCFKQFRILFNPKETCTECKSFVCHNCATNIKETNTWACKSCLELKELEVLTLNWFYLQSSNKHKRCGSAKVIRELHKREKELSKFN